MTDQNLTVENVDPSTLLVDVNVRSDAALDKDFLASIRDLGVLVPVVAVRTPDDALRVRYGHRRTLAAVEVGRASVPVIVTGDDDADETARIVSQWHENEHRAGLSTADKVAAVEQLSLLGLSAAQIVKKTRGRKDDVERALATASSALAKGAATRYDFLTLDMAAAVAEFDDQPETVKALVASAKSSEGEFAHCLQRARDEREEAAKVTALTAELAAAGVSIIDRPRHDERDTHPIDNLADDKGKPLAAAGHAACPGHAAYIGRDWRGVRPVYVCTQVKTAGHRDRYSSSGRPAGTPMTDAEKQERRQVLANNKAWKSAETVRRAFLTKLLARKAAPKGSATYVAGELGRGIHEIRRGMERSHHLAAELLGLDPAKGRDVIAASAADATDARAQVLALAVVLGDIEEATSTDTWRHSSDTVRRYFAFLVANGYELADVEKLAAGQAKRRRSAARGNVGSDTAA
ncbi:MAG TPA: ParB/RepB/Spo0J family partition protein [Jatrophihabitantaceae bacterium]|jgi:ParB family chromosome partitioning protein